MSDGESKSTATIVLISGVVLGLLPWGLGLIGVTVNLPLGAVILAAAFVLCGYAFWIWEKASRWHVLLRGGTIVAAACLYFYLIGTQILREYRAEHRVSSATEQSPTIESSQRSSAPGQKPKPQPDQNKNAGNGGEKPHQQRNPAAPKHAPKSEVALRFVYRSDPALVIVNPSDAVARDIKWAVELWNMDLPDRDDPLPIPISTFDWIKPHEEGGPMNLFDNALVSPLLKPGNRLFGSASVNCPDCARGRSYIVYIVWGESGWVSEIKDEKSGRLLTPPNLHKEYREVYFNSLETVPMKERIAIGER